ncbi:MAG: hypothetical protein H6707_18360 [Deltaproteobacteria bacterium]|nr:hypothetical protein [Deltaproteobacteria bacterium]
MNRQQVLQHFFPDLRHHNEQVIAATSAIPRANRGKVPLWQQLLNILGIVKVRDAVTRETIALTPTSVILVRMNMEDDDPALIEVRRYPFEQISAASVGEGRHTTTVLKLQCGEVKDEIHFWPAVDETMRPDQATYQAIFPELQAMTAQIAQTFAARRAA